MIWVASDEIIVRIFSNNQNLVTINAEDPQARQETESTLVEDVLKRRASPGGAPYDSRKKTCEEELITKGLDPSMTFGELNREASKAVKRGADDDEPKE